MLTKRKAPRKPSSVNLWAADRVAQDFKNHTTKTVFKAKEFLDACSKEGVKKGDAYTYLKENANRISHGTYTFNEFIVGTAASVDVLKNQTATQQQQQRPRPSNSSSGAVNPTWPDRFPDFPTTAGNKPRPAKAPVEPEPVIEQFNGVTFVKWGHFKDIGLIIASNMFFPVYITGESGNGKTVMVEEACKATKREMVRVQISPETSEDDLIGGFRLVNGETVFEKGPVIRAMDMGAILLIDEIDRGTNNIMCLQGVLEGKPVMIKKTGEVVTPKEGFNVIATSNTKGKGSDDGRYIAASIIDESFLERFAVTFVQPFPPAAVETAILNKKAQSLDIHPTAKAREAGYIAMNKRLVAWANIIRTTYEKNGINEVVSTRRLCSILTTYSIFEDMDKAIKLCINKFDDDTQTAMLELYRKL